jgi:hypothetical protein
MVRAGTCERKEKDKCPYSHDEGLLREAWRKLLTDLVELSPYKDLAWLSEKIQHASLKTPAPKEVKIAPPPRGAPPAKKAE